MSVVNIFTERNKKLIFGKKIDNSMSTYVRRQLITIMKKYNVYYQDIDDYGSFYNTDYLRETCYDLECFYKIEYMGKNGLVKSPGLDEFLLATYPLRTLDALEVFSSKCDKVEFIESINCIFQNNELPYVMKIGKIQIKDLDFIDDKNTKKIQIINNKQYDVFISHASIDKAAFVDELKIQIEKTGAKVWYDASCIGWGDSLSEKIDDNDY